MVTKTRGGNIMKNLFNGKILMLVGVTLLGSISLVSLSAESYQGGTWNHGSDVFNVWSEYKHNSVSHYAAIQERGGHATCTDDSASAGYWANAYQGNNPTTDQIAYAGHGTTFCQ